MSIHFVMLLCLPLLVLLLPHPGQTSPISCHNDKGIATDWFYLYKLPKCSGHTSAAEGLLYLLLDKGNSGWLDGMATVNDSASALGSTVGQLYTPESRETAFILYNDQQPDGVPAVRKKHSYRGHGGHAKGVVMLDKEQGFWLVHSTPRFPPVRRGGAFAYPHSGVINGQNFLCITFPLQSFQTIGEQLKINQVAVYDCDVPPSLATLVPSLAALCKKKRAMSNATVAEDKQVSNRSVTLTSQGGTQFISFAKGATFKNDLYHAWVAPTLQSDLLVQFWRASSSPVLPSDCSLGWKVLDISLLSPGKKPSYTTTHDHSKWAVSTVAAGGPGGGWVCVGDINRIQAQEYRGGGTVCQRNPAVWKAYRTAALQCEMCGGATGQC
ncbi:deoxyribonuclease-2-alpha [Synchiropus picturatus]